MTTQTGLPRVLHHTVAGIAVALTLTACGSGNVTKGEGSASSPTLPGMQSQDDADEPTSTPTPTSTSSGDDTNARGNIVTAVGEEGVLAAEDGTSLYTFAIDSITPDVACTEDYSYPAENGHLTAVQMRVSTGAVSADELGYVGVSGYDFVFIGSDGLTFSNVDTVATYGCVDDSLEFPSDQLRPGSQYAGTLVLDLPEASGTLVYQPSNADVGWEITY